MQIPLGNYVVRVRWMVVCVMVAAMWSCVRLGLWQWHKAEQKQEITRALTYHAGAIQVQAFVLDDATKVQALHLQTVELTGHYLPEFSFLLDNQVEQGQAGFHVITPFLLKDQQHVVWVNRGWIAGFSDHQKTPAVATPQTEKIIKGLFWQQTKIGFRLDKPGQAWEAVQPVIDFAYLRQHVPYTFPDVIIKLDSGMPDGYVRHWEVPSGQVEKHLSYAYQWFGFALASLAIGLYQMVEKRA